MSRKILVAYATWAGTTRGVADFIAKELTDKNTMAEVQRAGRVTDISAYDVVVLGTAIHAGKTVGDFSKFLRRFHEPLKSKKLAYFVVCANMFTGNEQNRVETLGWLNKALVGLEDLKPVDIGLFAGGVITEGEDYQRLNFIVKAIIGSMKESIIKQYNKSDLRDWNKISQWGKELKKKY
jgi:menaquinone-dependent protoporphyrinogen IX oxidase